jgi:hypothetical protein
MGTPQQKAFCVLRFSKSESVIILQREFRIQFRSDPPCKTNIATPVQEFAGAVESNCGCSGRSNNGYVAASLGRNWLWAGCAPCETRCTYWGIVTNRYGTWKFFYILKYIESFSDNNLHNYSNLNGSIILTFNITVFNATLFVSFYSSTTCFGHTGPSPVIIAIVVKAVSLSL